MVQLTEEQAKARDTIIAFLLDPKPSRHAIVLQGTAGTGKSTIISKVYNDYKEQHKLLRTLDPKTPPPMSWIFTATTNKAVDSLRKATGLVHIQTIQSLLGLVPRNGALVSTHKSEDINNMIVVIDEASYVDYTLMFYITKYLGGCKVIYMGDPTQLPPVGLNHAPVFTEGYPTVFLTKSMRQLNSPSIDKFCKELRHFIEHNGNFPSLTLSNEIVLLSQEDFVQQIHAMDASTSRILASKNNTVNKYNNTLFKAKHNRSYFDKGDKVINNRYVKGIGTDEIVTIIETPTKFKQFDVDGYLYTIRAISGTMQVFMPDKISMTNKMVKAFADNRDWQSVQKIQETWVDLRPHFACTIHKSQGSTFDEVYIDLNDFKTERDLKQLARLLYVAVSRAKRKVTLTGDIR